MNDEEGEQDMKQFENWCKEKAREEKTDLFDEFFSNISREEVSRAEQAKADIAATKSGTNMFTAMTHSSTANAIKDAKRRWEKWDEMTWDGGGGKRKKKTKRKRKKKTKRKRKRKKKTRRKSKRKKKTRKRIKRKKRTRRK